MLRDSETNELIVLNCPGKTLVGRAKVCEIQPESTSISKKHASIELIVEEGTNNILEIWIEDLGSRNGTFTGPSPDKWKIISEKKRKITFGEFIKFGLSITYYRVEERGVTTTNTNTSPDTSQLQDYEPHSLTVQPVKQSQVSMSLPDFQAASQRNTGQQEGANNLDDLYSSIDDSKQQQHQQSQQAPRVRMGRNVSPINTSLTSSHDPGRGKQFPISSLTKISNTMNTDTLLQTALNNEKINVSIEYREGFKSRKPPVSIIIGGDDEEKSWQQQQDVSGLSWDIENSNTQTEQLRMPPVPVAMTFHHSNELLPHRLQDPKLASSLDIDIESRAQQEQQQQQQYPPHGDTMWDTDVSDSYMRHLSDIMSSSGGRLSQKIGSHNFSNFSSFEKHGPTSLSVSQSPLDLRGGGLGGGGGGGMGSAFGKSVEERRGVENRHESGETGGPSRPSTRGKTSQLAPPTPTVSSSLMNPLLMDEDSRRSQQSSHTFFIDQNRGLFTSNNLNRSAENNFSSLSTSFQLQGIGLTPEERKVVEVTRDAMAGGIRVANKALGGLLDMQSWRQYASQIMGGVSGLTEEDRKSDAAGKSESLMEQKDEQVMSSQEKHNDYLRSIMSPKVLKYLHEETDFPDRRYRAKETLHQVIRNICFLIDYESSFTLEDSERQQVVNNTNNAFDGVLYNKIIDNIVGLLTKRFSVSRLVQALDQCFGVLEVFIAQCQDAPFNEMVLPAYALNGGLANLLESIVLPKLNGLKTFNLGMKTSEVENLSSSKAKAQQSKDNNNILSNFQLEQVNKRILTNIQEDLLPVMSMLNEIYEKTLYEPKLTPGVSSSSSSGENIAPNKEGRRQEVNSNSSIEGTRRQQASQQGARDDGSKSSSLPGLSAEYTPGELRLSANSMQSQAIFKSKHKPKNSTSSRRKEENFSRKQNDSVNDSSYKSNHHSLKNDGGKDKEGGKEEEDDDEEEGDYALQVAEGEEAAVRVYESWLEVKLFLETVVAGSGAVSEQAATELQEEVSQWYRNYIESGQLTGKKATSHRQGRLESYGSSTPRYDSMQFLTSEEEEDIADRVHGDGEGDVDAKSRRGKLKESWEQLNELLKAEDSDEKLMQQIRDSERQLKLKKQKELQAEQRRLDQEKYEAGRVAIEKEKQILQQQLEKEFLLRRENAINGMRRIRKRIFTSFLMKRFRIWQLFTLKRRAQDTAQLLMSDFDARRQQMTAEERTKYEETLKEKEKMREDIIRVERQKAEEMANERAEIAEKQLENLIRVQREKETSETAEKISSLLNEKELLLEEERARHQLEIDIISSAEKEKEEKLMRQINDLSTRNINIALDSQKKLHLLKILSRLDNDLQFSTKYVFSKWLRCTSLSRQSDRTMKENENTLRRIFRILASSHQGVVKDALLRAFHKWERFIALGEYRAQISKSEAEVVADLRSKVLDLQEELLAITSKEEGAASWVAERALNRELSSANHDLQQRFSDLQWKLLEVAKVPPSERKQLVSSVLLDREQEVAKSRKEVRVLREQIRFLEKYLKMPVTDRPTVNNNSDGHNEARNDDPATELSKTLIYGTRDRGSKNKDEGHEYDAEHSKFYRQKFHIGNKMTKQDALQVVLSEMKHLQEKNVHLKDDNTRLSSTLVEETERHFELSLSLSVLQQRLLSKERKLEVFQKALTQHIGSNEVARLLDNQYIR